VLTISPQTSVQVLSWYRKQEFYTPDPVLYHSCIYPLEPEQYYLGWKYFMFMKVDECGASPTAYTQLLRLAAQSNAFWRAFEIMKDMRKHVPGRPDVRDFNNLMGSMLRSRRPIPCEKVFLKMHQAEVSQARGGVPGFAGCAVERGCLGGFECL
jgi:hypothetical protein